MSLLFPSKCDKFKQILNGQNVTDQRVLPDTLLKREHQ